MVFQKKQFSPFDPGLSASYRNGFSLPGRHDDEVIIARGELLRRDDRLSEKLPAARLGIDKSRDFFRRQCMVDQLPCAAAGPVDIDLHSSSSLSFSTYTHPNTFHKKGHAKISASTDLQKIRNPLY